MEEMFQINGTDLVIKVPRELDHHCAKRMNMGADRIIERKNIRRLIYDFRMTEFMDSSGIGMIIGRYKTVSALGGKLSIAAPSKEADRILAISGIYRIIHSYKTVEDAVLGINQEVHKNEK